MNSIYQMVIPEDSVKGRISALSADIIQKWEYICTQSADINELGDIFLKNLLIECFWWALRDKEFDFFNF